MYDNVCDITLDPDFFIWLMVKCLKINFGLQVKCQSWLANMAQKYHIGHEFITKLQY
jgi:hypothetical protein